MGLSDILNFVGIIVSIVFGFFVSHWYSIRDSRTRVIKDNYIEQIKSIKGRVDKFFHQVIWGKSSSAKIVTWYTHIGMDVDSIDNGVKKALDLHIEPIGALLFKNQQRITAWDDYNDQFSNAHYIPSNEHVTELLEMMSQTDQAFNNYISHINQANNFSILTIQWRKINENHRYYESQNKKFPWVRAFIERVLKHFWEALFIGMVIWIFCHFCLPIRNREKDSVKEALDSIYIELKYIEESITSFERKYEPININTKTFNNSAFFNAGKVDSVEIKLYQNKDFPE